MSKKLPMLSEAPPMLSEMTKKSNTSNIQDYDIRSLLSDKRIPTLRSSIQRDNDVLLEQILSKRKSSTPKQSFLYQPDEEESDDEDKGYLSIKGTISNPAVTAYDIEKIQADKLKKGQDLATIRLQTMARRRGAMRKAAKVRNDLNEKQQRVFIGSRPPVEQLKINTKVIFFSNDDDLSTRDNSIPGVIKTINYPGGYTGGMPTFGIVYKDKKKGTCEFNEFDYKYIYQIDNRPDLENAQALLALMNPTPQTEPQSTPPPGALKKVLRVASFGRRGKKGGSRRKGGHPL